MKYEELSPYVKRRFNKARICPECNQVIFNEDDFIVEIKTIARSKYYIFSHARCVTNVQIIEKAAESKEGSTFWL